MSVNNKKIIFLEELATWWNDGGRSYAVASGLRGYPLEIGRDIDVVFQSKDLAWAVSSTELFLRKKGFSVLHYRLGWLHWIIGFRESDHGFDSVQVDLFDHLQWAFSWVVDGLDSGDYRNRIGPFQVDPWVSVGKRIFLNGLSGKFETFKKKPFYLDTIEAERSVMKRNLLRLAGRDFPKLRASIVSKDIEGIVSGFRDLRKAVLRKSLFEPTKWFRRIACAWEKQYFFRLRPPWHLPVIVYLGKSKCASEDFLKGFIDLVQREFPFSVRNINIHSAGDAGLRVLNKRLKHLSIRRSSSQLELVVVEYLHDGAIRDKKIANILPCRRSSRHNNGISCSTQSVLASRTPK